MFQLLPDLDQVVVDFLTNHPALTGLHGGRVGTSLRDGDNPAVRTTSLGGPNPWPWETRPDMQIEWWGGDQGQAKTLCRTGEAALWELIGPVTGGHITGLSMPLTQLWSPDDETGRARYLTQISITASPEGT